MDGAKSKIGEEILRKHQKQITEYVEKHGTFVGFEFEINGVKHKVVDGYDDIISQTEEFIKQTENKIKKYVDTRTRKSR